MRRDCGRAGVAYLLELPLHQSVETGLVSDCGSGRCVLVIVGPTRSLLKLTAYQHHEGLSQAEASSYEHRKQAYPTSSSSEMMSFLCLSAGRTPKFPPCMT